MKILIAGDFCPHNRVASLIEENKYNEVFGEVKPYTESVDLAIVNLEAPVVVSSDAKPIDKCGPNLRCTSKAIDALKYAGFNMVTLANNHLYDFGKEGLIDTLMACKNGNIATVGAGINLSEASKTSYQTINNQILAIVNCCEHEFSIATETTGGCNPLNPIQQFYAIQEAKQKADYVIVIVHGGHEHYQLPSPRMKETYRFFIDAGADAVINHHQHCYSGYEVYNGKPIFYGLGNFCFDWNGTPSKMWTEGYLVEIDFSNDITFKIYPYCQYGNEATIKLLEKDSFDETINKLNEIISNPKLLNDKTLDYYNSSKESISTFLEPIRNRYIRGLQNRGLFPKLMNNQWLPILMNAVMCEAHKDKLNYYLLSELDKYNKNEQNNDSLKLIEA